jgi:heme-degrading monooxygenase HmoA
MIIAISRFRVINHREQDVRQAFLNRPRLVDDQAGFLGIEIFQDHTDCAIFNLVTRWTDHSSFRKWHSSPAHQRSHELMPKGLKLDSAFTEIRILERLEDERDQDAFEHFPGDWEALMRAYLVSSTKSHAVVARPAGVILGATGAMERLLGRDSGRLNGQPVWEFLTPESTEELRRLVSARSRDSQLRFPMTFMDADSSRHALICNLDVQPNAFALLCEPFSEAGNPVVAAQRNAPEGGSEK